MFDPFTDRLGFANKLPNEISGRRDAAVSGPGAWINLTHSGFENLQVTFQIVL